MTKTIVSTSRALAAARGAAGLAGALMRTPRYGVKKINVATRHDIKLELDVRCQKLIESSLQRVFPQIPILGEEGILGDPESEYRWVVDPIDGTVNFTYGIPHACVSIALQRRCSGASRSSRSRGQRGRVTEAYESLVGVVYDPFCDELWTAIRGQRARMNGRAIHVSRRARLTESIVAIGFAKESATLRRMLPVFNRLIHRVRKVRIMGAAALGLTYVASGRLDGYLEFGLRLWDIAAGGLILECAGGDFWSEPLASEYGYRIAANNGVLRKPLKPHLKGIFSNR